MLAFFEPPCSTPSPRPQSSISISSSNPADELALSAAPLSSRSPPPSRSSSLVSEPLNLFLPSLYFLLPSNAVGSPNESGSDSTVCPPMPAGSSEQTK